MKLKTVKLLYGKYDGSYSACSSDKIRKCDDSYVISDNNTEEFISVKHLLNTLPHSELCEELNRVWEYLKHNEKCLLEGRAIDCYPLASLVGISPMRIRAWKEAIDMGYVKPEFSG